MKKEMRIIIKELLERLPKTNKEGFMAEDKVYNAIAKVKEYCRTKEVKNDQS
tara:strand:+ start:695 stop:850 length:156 start_codon:yes stop_codon:yes gene_type:complete